MSRVSLSSQPRPAFSRYISLGSNLPYHETPYKLSPFEKSLSPDHLNVKVGLKRSRMMIVCIAPDLSVSNIHWDVQEAFSTKSTEKDEILQDVETIENVASNIEKQVPMVFFDQTIEEFDDKSEEENEEDELSKLEKEDMPLNLEQDEINAS